MNDKIRKALISDIPRLQDIRAAVRENVLSDPSKVTYEDYIWFIEHGHVWLYEDNHEIKGFSAGDPRDGTIWALFVDPDFEAQGIGRQLFSCVCQSMHKEGHKELSLSTAPGSRAENFYRAAGWASTATTRHGDIVFSKHFGPS